MTSKEFDELALAHINSIYEAEVARDARGIPTHDPEVAKRTTRIVFSRIIGRVESAFEEQFIDSEWK